MKNVFTRFASERWTGNSAWLAVAGLVWVALLAAGMAWMLGHDFTPGESSGEVPNVWPEDVARVRRSGVATLVMAVHPGCPCTRASLDQLERLIVRTGPRLRVMTLHFSSPATDTERVGVGTRNVISSNSRIEAMMDRDGELAKRFGLVTSGEVAVYDREGRLRFHGGLTPSRGCSAPGTGFDAVLALANGNEIARPAAPVFGCSILDTP
jgi:hypothetical protein